MHLPHQSNREHKKKTIVKTPNLRGFIKKRNGITIVIRKGHDFEISGVEIRVDTKGANFPLKALS